MPKRHRRNNPNKISTGFSQGSGSTAPSQGALRARPALPGRIPQVEEAALFSGVTQAPAEPKTGATPPENNKIPLRNNDVLESKDSAPTVLIRGQPKQCNDDLGIDSASEQLYGLSVTEVVATQEGAKETISALDPTNPDLFDYNLDNTVNVLCRTNLFTDKSYKIIVAY